MRIVYFYQYFTTPKGAWSTRVYEFCRRWSKLGDEVTVITSAYDKSDIQPSGLIHKERIENINVIVVGIKLSNKHNFILRIFTFLLYAIISCWYALTLPADVVIASSGPITTAIPGLVAKFIRRRRLAFEIRDLWPDGAIELGVLKNRLLIALSKRFEGFCYAAADLVVAVSDGMADALAAQVPRRKMVVIPNASDNAVYPDIQNASNERLARYPKKIVSYTGTIGIANGCEQLLRMAECLQERGRRDVEVVLVGDGKERPQLEAEARRRQLENIRFTGIVPKMEALAWLYYSQCSLLVFKNSPIIGTGSPNKLFDSLAMGVPVIQNTQNWIKALFSREECGLTVEADDAEAMAAAVCRVLDEPELRERMSRNARRVALEQFDRDLLATRMRAALAELGGR